MNRKVLYQADVRKVNDLKDLLNQSAEIFGDKEAFKIRINESVFESISFKEFKNDVDALGTALLNLGLSNAPISLIGENRYEWCTSYLSVVNGVGIVVPLDRELPKNEIENLLFRSKSRALIFSGKLLNSVKELFEKGSEIEYFINMDADEDEYFYLSYKKLLEKGKQLIRDGNLEYINAKINNEAMNMLIFTSGTTDLAKGVMLSHKNICADIMSISSCLYIDSSDSILSILPLHHTYECTAGFLVMVYNGCSIAFCEGLKYIAKNINEIKPSILMLVPLILESVYKKIWSSAGKKPYGKVKLKIGLAISNFLSLFHIDITKKLFHEVHESLGGNLRLVISGAAGLSPDVSRGFRNLGFNVLQGYGLTECSPIVAVNRDEAFRHNSIGLPIPGIEVKLNEPDEDGIGELMVKGDIVMLGYYENSRATKNVLNNGWLYTGDLCKVEADGFIRITGRKKNVIVTKNGKNIFPEEVEEYLSKSEFILESLVTGEYDDETGETYVAAQIYPNYDSIEAKLKIHMDDEAEIQKVLQAEVKKINKAMPLYKHIRHISIRTDEFAKTTTRKIKRYGQNVKQTG